MSLNGTIAGLKKEYGDAILRAGNEVPAIRRIPLFEMPVFDYVTCGGLIHNRINELLGAEGSLKSWVMYRLIGIYQKMEWETFTRNALCNFTYGKRNEQKFTLKRHLRQKIKHPKALRAALIDIEHTYTPEWGEKMGIDTKGLIISQPDRLEDAVDVAVALCGDPAISLVCIDSISATGTKEEIDSAMEKDQMGVAARFWNKATRKLQAAMNSNPNGQITLILINSEYEGMGQYEGSKIRNGGQLKRSKSLSVRFRGAPELTEDGEVVGRNVNIKCMKNKGGGPSFRTSNFFYSYVDMKHTLAYTTDINTQILDLAVKHDIVKRNGKTYKYGKLSIVGFATFVNSATKRGLVEEISDKVYDQVINKYIK